MTAEAKIARDNAFRIECKKDGLTQKQNGDWKLTVVIAAQDMLERFAMSPMGTLYETAWVEVTDTGSPRNFKGEERQRWRDMGAVRQAAIRCQDHLFWRFLEEELHVEKILDEEIAAIFVRQHCHVKSRADMDKAGFTDARQLWHQLDNAFQAWKVRENAE